MSPVCNKIVRLCSDKARAHFTETALPGVGDTSRHTQSILRHTLKVEIQLHHSSGDAHTAPLKCVCVHMLSNTHTCINMLTLTHISPSVARFLLVHVLHHLPLKGIYLGVIA